LLFGKQEARLTRGFVGISVTLTEMIALESERQVEQMF